MGFTVSKTTIILLSLVIVGALLRMVNLADVPGIPHRDEMAIGYNAYSLLLTGHDEHGERWPVAFTSFGDYKLPGLIYATIISLQTFGMNLFAVRFPTALAAIVTIPALYWLVRQIGWKRQVASIAALFITLDFWHITQARNAYEPIVGLFYSVICWASWLAAERDKRWYILTVVSYLLGSLTYNLPFLLLPLLFVGSWLIQRDWKKSINQILKTDAWWLGALAILAVCCITVSWLTSEVTAGKSNVTVFSHMDSIQRSQTAVHAGLGAGLPSLIARGISHPVVLGIMQAIEGYVAAFNPTYLFFLGDHNPWHNLRSIELGDMNPVLLVVFVIGLYVVVKNYNTRASKLTLLYLLVSPVISALTIDAPITNRLLDFHVAVTIVAAVGAQFWWQEISQHKQLLLKYVYVGWATVYTGFFIFFFIKYFYLYNPLMESLWYPGLPNMITETKARAAEYDLIYVSSDLELGYIFFAFYTPFDPHQFQTTALWQKDGFQKVTAYDKYRFDMFTKFEDLTPKNVSQIFDDTRSQVLIVGKGKPLNHEQVLWQETDSKGEALWYIWQTDIPETLKTLQTLPKTHDRQKTINYLQSCLNGTCNPMLLQK